MPLLINIFLDSRLSIKQILTSEPNTQGFLGYKLLKNDAYVFPGFK